MELNVTSRTVNSSVVLDIAGEVDVYTAPTLQQAILTELSQDNFNLILNCTEVEFLDSTGLGVLVSALKRVRENDGSITLTNLSERIMKVFVLTGLTSAFVFKDTVEEAV